MLLPQVTTRKAPLHFAQTFLKVHQPRKAPSANHVYSWLIASDHINIPARQKHRVEWTHPDMTTVWLCVFY